mgnify:CR=1 FL=1
MKESQIQKQIVNLIRKRGGYAIVTTCPPCEYGTPDVLACYLGRALLIEVKTPKGVVSAIQTRRLEQWRAAGAWAMVARSVDDVAEALDHLEKDDA